MREHCVTFADSELLHGQCVDLLTARGWHAACNEDVHGLHAPQQRDGVRKQVVACTYYYSELTLPQIAKYGLQQLGRQAQ